MGLFIACAAIVQFAALSIFHGSPAAGIWARREVQELLMQQNGIILNSTHPPQSASSQQIPAAPSHNKTIRNRLVTTIRNFGGLGNNEDDRGNRAAAHPVPAAALPASSRSGPGSESGAPAALAPALGLHTFYYAWYGTPEVDGKWLHWDHEVLKHWGGPAVNSKYPTVGSRHSPPERIGSNYYPSAGPYSSRNESIIQQHVGMMADAGIGVLVYSWWGRGLGDANGDPTDTAIIANVFKHCLARNVKVSFHLEPYQGVQELRGQVAARLCARRGRVQGMQYATLPQALQAPAAVHILARPSASVSMCTHVSTSHLSGPNSFPLQPIPPTSVPSLPCQGGRRFPSGLTSFI
jgi:hypothetical protein